MLEYIRTLSSKPNSKTKAKKERFMPTLHDIKLHSPEFLDAFNDLFPTNFRLAEVITSDGSLFALAHGDDNFPKFYLQNAANLKIMESKITLIIEAVTAMNHRHEIMANPLGDAKDIDARLNCFIMLALGYVLDEPERKEYALYCAYAAARIPD